MYFFNLQGLVDRLSKTPLTARESLHYVFAFMVFNTSSKLIEAAVGKTASEGSWSAFGISFVLLGVYLAIAWAVLNRFLRANGGDDSKDFLQNVVALGWVISLRMSALLIPVIVIGIGLIKALGTNITLIVVLAVAMVILVLGTLFWSIEMMSSALEQIRNRRLDPQYGVAP